MDFYISVFVFACITVTGVVSIFLITGMTGLFSFGHAAFMSLGAYIAALLSMQLKLPIPLAMLGAIVIGGIIAFGVGYPTLKLRRNYFVLVTFGFGEAVAALLNYSVTITGGATGLSNIPTMPRGIAETTVIVSTIVIIILVANFKRSRFGRMCMAVKTDELSAKSMGIDVFRIKMKMFIMASVITCYGGAMFAFYVSYIDPLLFGWVRTSEWIIMLVFGGANSLTGAVVSAFLLTFIPEALRSASTYRMVIYCIIILIMINFRPSGLFNDFELSKTNIKRLIAKIKGNKSTS